MTGGGPHRLDLEMGQRIRARRRAVGMSQQALAESVGVTFQQVQKYERGDNRISFSRLVEMAAALGCRLGDLADGLEQGPPRELDGREALFSDPAAVQLLKAYAALPTEAVRHAMLRHVRALAEALGEGDPPP